MLRKISWVLLVVAAIAVLAGPVQAEPPWVCRTVFGVPGLGAGQFMHPEAFDFSPDGTRLAVCDTDNHRVVILAVASGPWTVDRVLGGPERSVGRIRHHEGISMDKLCRPQGVAWVDANTLLIADTDNHRVKAQRLDGEVLWVLGREGWKTGYFSYPMGIARDAQGNIYVAEPRANYLRSVALDVGQRQRVQGNRIQVFDPEGRAKSRFVGNMHRMSGRDYRQVKDPTRIYIDHEGEVWFSDTSNHRVLRFGADQQWKAQYQRWPDLVMNRPCGVHGNEKYVAIADTGNSRVILLDRQGKVLGVIGRHGIRPGEFAQPKDVRFGPDGRLYVLDTMNCRIMAFAPFGAPPRPVALPLPEGGSPAEGAGDAADGASVSASLGLASATDAAAPLAADALASASAPVDGVDPELSALEPTAPAAASAAAPVAAGAAVTTNP